MRWKIFQWMKFLFRHSSNSRKLSQQKFHNELACVFTAALRKQKCRLKSTTTNGWRNFGQSKWRKSFVLFPIQSEKSPDSGFFTYDPTRGGGGGGGGSYFPYILLNEIQTMFSQLAKRSARVLPADLVLIMRITSKSIDLRS